MHTLDTSGKPRMRSEVALLNSAASSRPRSIAAGHVVHFLGVVERVLVEDVLRRPSALPAHAYRAGLALGDHGKAERRSAGRGHRSARQELAARSRLGFLGLFLAH